MPARQPMREDAGREDRPGEAGPEETETLPLAGEPRLPFAGETGADPYAALAEALAGRVRPATARFVLYDEWGLQIRVTVFGEGTDRPVAGDWNGDGVYGAGDRTAGWGGSNDLPIAGRWRP
jgi:hypothetical protein